MAHGPLAVLGWIIAIALGVGLFAGAVLLMPAVTALVASFFADEIAELVERTHYPADPPGVALPLVARRGRGRQDRAAGDRGLSLRHAVPAVRGRRRGAVLPRHRVAAGAANISSSPPCASIPSAEAKALRRIHRGTVFIAGLFIAAFVSIPILNLATPLFGTALMVHIHKRLTGGARRELIETRRAGSL